jgi:hypothetical protein
VLFAISKLNELILLQVIINETDLENEIPENQDAVTMMSILIVGKLRRNFFDVVQSERKIWKSES